jgi:hypothetical protein
MSDFVNFHHERGSVDPEHSSGRGIVAAVFLDRFNEEGDLEMLEELIEIEVVFDQEIEI